MIDFQVDYFKDGTSFTGSFTIDEHTHLVLGDTPEVSITEEDILGNRDRLDVTHGHPAILQMD